MQNTRLKLTFILVLVAVAGFGFAPSHSVNAVTVFDSMGPLSGGHCGVVANRITIPVGDNYILNSITVTSNNPISILEDSSGTMGALIETLGSGAGVPLTPSSTITLISGNSYWIRSATNCWSYKISAPVGIFPLTGAYWSAGVARANGYQMSIDASVYVPATPIAPVAPSAVVIPTDGRLNPQMADATEAVLYPAFDSAGNPTVQAYCVNPEAQGYLGLVISEADLPETAPAENTLLLESDVCDIEFWALADGSDSHYQLNVGPNIDGTVTEFLFNDIGAGGLQMRTFNLYQLGD